MISTLLFLAVLAVLILVHEFGHFFSAKKFGLFVHEFGLGFPPRLWGKKIGETIYSINWIPFGGFVKIFGEDAEEEKKQDLDNKNLDIPKIDKSRSLSALPKWKQIIVLSAGVLMNILLAWALFFVSYMSGMDTVVSGVKDEYVKDKRVIVLGVSPKSPAEKANFKAGDFINSYYFDGATTTVSSVEQIQSLVASSSGKEIIFSVKSNAEEKIIKVLPENNFESQKYVIGIAMDMAGKVNLPPHLAFWESTKLTFGLIKDISVNIFDLIVGLFSGSADLSQVSGPVGIARLVGDAGSMGFVYLMSFTAFISLNLAVLNMIPFPALDGGRILFVIIEAIKRSPINPKVANNLNIIGFFLLIALMLFVTYKDVVKLF